MDFSSSCKAQVNFNSDRVYSSLDIIAGDIRLDLSAETSIKNIVVKLEGVAATKISVQREDNGRRDRNNNSNSDRQEILKEEHKVLYLQQIAFPPKELAQSSSTGIFTLKPGTYHYPFKFRIPANANCSSDNANHHVQGTLPPSFTALGSFAEVKYFVKCTVVRSGFFKTNSRNIRGFNFSPIDRPPLDTAGRIAFVRRDVIIPIPFNQAGAYSPEKGSTTSAAKLAEDRKRQEEIYNQQNAPTSAATNSSTGNWGGKLTQGSDYVSQKIPVGGKLVGSLGKHAADMADRLQQKTAGTSGQYSSGSRGIDETPPAMPPRNENPPPAPPRPAGNATAGSSSGGFLSKLGFGDGIKKVMGMRTGENSTTAFSLELRHASNAIFVPNQNLPLQLYLVFDTSQGHLPPNRYPCEAIYLADLIFTLYSKTCAKAQNRSQDRQLKLNFFKARVNQALYLNSAVQRPGVPHVWELKVPYSTVSEAFMPSFVTPTFQTCNIQSSYTLEVAAGFIAVHDARMEYVSVTTDVIIGSGRSEGSLPATQASASSSQADGFSGAWAEQSSESSNYAGSGNYPPEKPGASRPTPPVPQQQPDNLPPSEEGPPSYSELP